MQVEGKSAENRAQQKAGSMIQDLKDWCTVAEKLAPLVRKGIEAIEEVFGNRKKKEEKTNG